MKLATPSNIAAITPYPPGKPLEELEREYGISNSIKLASNENPFGPSPLAVEAIRECLDNLHRYPDGSSYYLTQAMAEYHAISSDKLVLGNGSNEVIEFLIKCFVGDGDEVISSFPSFLMYQKFVQVRGGKNVVIQLQDMGHDLEAITDAVNGRTRLIFLDNPNNPCGSIIEPARFDAFVRSLPENLIVVLDEAYVDFVKEESRIDLLSYIREPDNIPAVVGLRTFSKAWGLAGLRLGYGIMHPKVASLLQRVRQPFNINTPAQAGGLAALSDHDHYEKTLTGTAQGMAWLSKEAEKLGCTPYPSHTNFFLINVGIDANLLYEAMLHEGVIVRSMAAYSMPSFIRITVGTEAENRRLIKSLAGCLEKCGRK